LRSLVSAIKAFQFILSWVNREYIVRRSSSDRRAVRRGAGKHSMNSYESQSLGVQFLFRFLFEASEDLTKTKRALIPDQYSKLDDEMRLFTASLAHAKGRGVEGGGEGRWGLRTKRARTNLSRSPPRLPFALASSSLAILSASSTIKKKKQ